MKKSYIYIIAFSSILSGIGGSLFTVHLLMSNQETSETAFTSVSHNQEEIVGFTPHLTSTRTYLPDNSEDFVLASNKSQSSVVFIQTLNEYEYRTGSWLDWFFEPRNSQQIGSGSGVILSKDGYIVTNNHVIDDADRIQVVHGKRTYDAELVGTDPSTDLAVIKVNVSDLPDRKSVV